MQSSVGYRTFHQDVTLNYTLNRLAADVPAELLQEVADRVTSLEDWIVEALQIADRLETDGKFIEAAYFLRGAEFFMSAQHPSKGEAYERYMTLFDRTHPEVAGLRRSLEYKGGALSVIDIPAQGIEKDVILACNGFDGLIEEMYNNMCVLAEAGYRVVLYEGDGQGAALRRYGLPMIKEWEQPVTHVLDQLGIQSCTLLGLSLGGYLAPRAAAFEPRVRRVISWGQMYDLFDCFRGRAGSGAFEALCKMLDSGERDKLNAMARASMESNSGSRWAITHGMHTCAAEDPFGYYSWAREMNLREISERITQDCLIMAGAEDHLVPLDQIWTQAAALKNAMSITTRVFTVGENAAEHCQSTNPAPALREILRWLETLAERDTLAAPA